MPSSNQYNSEEPRRLEEGVSPAQYPGCFVIELEHKSATVAGKRTAWAHDSHNFAASIMPNRPNILFIMSDDHAAHAISAYGSVINQTPNIDRIANAGLRLDNCFCTNSICTPSRATILTGQYGHVSGVKTLADTLDNARPVQLQKQLKEAGYKTAIFGKWHLGHGPQSDGTDASPAGFDDWQTLPGQGLYFDPIFHTPRGDIKYSGYVSEVITDLSHRLARQLEHPTPGRKRGAVFRVRASQGAAPRVGARPEIPALI